MSKTKTMELPVQLTRDEVRERGVELAQLVEKLRAAEANKKAVSKSLKDDIDEIRKDVLWMKDVVRHGRELRLVPVAERVKLEGRTVETIRMDTEEVVASRPMTETEVEEAQQGRLFIEHDQEDE